MQNSPDPMSARKVDDTVTHDAHALIPNGFKAEIVLDEQTYILRITRAGKLILTK